MTSDILVVDDDQALRQMVALTLENEGYSVGTVENGREALHLICPLRA